MGDFARDTAVVSGGSGAYSCAIHPDWWVVAGPNGGYIAALIVRALDSELGAEPRRPLRSLALHYLRAPREGPATISVEVERAGRSVSFVSARLEQSDRLCVLARAVLALDREGFELPAQPAPRVPEPDELEPLPDRPDSPPFARQFDYLPAIGAPPFAGADEALTGGWIRLREARPPARRRAAGHPVRLLVPGGVRHDAGAAGHSHARPHGASARPAPPARRVGPGRLPHARRARRHAGRGRHTLVARRRAARPVAPARACSLSERRAARSVIGRAPNEALS